MNMMLKMAIMERKKKIIMVSLNPSTTIGANMAEALPVMLQIPTAKVAVFGLKYSNST